MYKITNVTTPSVIEGEGLYSYKVYTGENTINLDKGDSAWIVEGGLATVKEGPESFETNEVCTVIRGYSCGFKTSTFSKGTNLPYVNGCSTEQIFPAIRLGDPTLQMLLIPANSSEQQHHVHSTDRVVYVVKGKGKSIIGLKNEIELELVEGVVLVLDKMVPHHFETSDEPLIVLPLHIYSSQTAEFNHPMFNGTFKV